MRRRRRRGVRRTRIAYLFRAALNACCEYTCAKNSSFSFSQPASPPTPAFPLMEHISEPLNRILDYETMGAFCGALQNHLPVVAQSGKPDSDLVAGHERAPDGVRNLALAVSTFLPNQADLSRLHDRPNQHDESSGAPSTPELFHKALKTSIHGATGLCWLCKDLAQARCFAQSEGVADADSLGKLGRSAVG